VRAPPIFAGLAIIIAALGIFAFTAPPAPEVPALQEAVACSPSQQVMLEIHCEPDDINLIELRQYPQCPHSASPPRVRYHSASFAVLLESLQNQRVPEVARMCSRSGVQTSPSVKHNRGKRHTGHASTHLHRRPLLC
jgi:hypothetical protein